MAQPRPTMQRGDTWWAALPSPAGRRPVVLLSRQEAYAVRANVTVAEVTTTIRGLSTEVTLGKREGMPKRCVVNLDSLQTIPKSCLVERAGSLRKEKLTRLDDALRFALGLDG